jgi:plastocyanin
MKKKLMIASLTAVLTLFTAAIFLLEGRATPTTKDNVQAQEVRVDNFTFGPNSVTVPVNSTVTWVNKDDVPHVIASDDGVFKSKALDTDDKYSYTFTKPGEYPYFCSLHPKMVGKVLVK